MSFRRDLLRILLVLALFLPCIAWAQLPPITVTPGAGISIVPGASNRIVMQPATNSQPGYLTAADFATFASATVPTFVAPLVNTSGTVTCTVATAVANGCLQSSDWSVFNGKEPAITVGTTLQYWRGDKTFQTLNTTVVPEGSNLYFTTARAQGAVSASAPLVDTAGVFSIPQATGSVDGFLLHTDWSTFNGKQALIASYSSPSHQFFDAYAAGVFSSAQPAFTDLSGSIAGAQIPSSTVTNAMLVNASTQVNGQSCALGGSCTVADGTAVDSVSVSSSNGFAGTSSGGQNPILTLQATNSGIQKSNGTALSAAIAGTDYQAPITTSSAPSNQFATGFTAPNTITYAQPTYANLGGVVPTWNQNTTGTSANITATSNSTLTSLPSLALPTGQLTGSVALTQLASQSADTFVANGTGGAAAPTAISAATAASILPAFVGDSGAGGTQGLVPAPAAYSSLSGDFLSAGGSFAFVDQSNTINNPFSLTNTLPIAGSPGAYKFESTKIFTSTTTGKNYAIAAGFISQTLTIWDISDQTNPVLVGNYTMGGGGAYNVSVGVQGGVQYAFVGLNSGSKLLIINLTNPAAPTLTSNTLITGSPGSIYGVSFLGGYVYCATQSTGLVVMDVGGGTGTPALPVQTYQQAGGVKSFGVVAVGTNVYTTSYSTSNPFTVRQIDSWTLAGAGSPSVPSLLQSLQVTAAGEALGLSVSGNTAFVTTAATGAYNINLVDITTPTAMTNLSQINSANSFGSAFYATAVGNVLYVPSGSNAGYGGAIDAYDISTRTAPVHLGQVTNGVPTAAFGTVAASGGYLFVADYGVASSNAGALDVFTGLTPNILTDSASINSLTVPAFSTAGVLHNNSSGLVSSSLVNLAADVTGLLPNGNLANPATTVNGQTCTLGSSCTVHDASAVTSVTATAPITSSGGTTPNIAIPASTNSVDGYFTSADHTTVFNSLFQTNGNTSSYAGTGAGAALSAGTNNVVLGPSAGALLSSGNFNVAVGSGALENSVTGNDNVAVGYQAEGGATGGTGGGDNVGIGYQALGLDSTGSDNIAIGTQSQVFTTSGSFNTSVGVNALFGVLGATGQENSAFGYEALQVNNSGSLNSAFGYFALIANTTGSGNTALGANALRFNTTGADNLGIGFQTLKSNSTGSDNTAVGYQAGSNTGGGAAVMANEAFFGYQAGFNENSGTDNTMLGNRAGNSTSTGSDNVVIGSTANLGAANNSVVAIGYAASATGDGCIAVGASTSCSVANQIVIGSSQTANTFLAAPNGSTGALTPRAIVGADLPAINLAASGAGGVTGNLPPTNLNSGSGASSTTFWRGDGSWAVPAPAAAPSTTVTATTSTVIPSLSANYILNVTTTSGALTTTLPDAVASNGYCAYIVDTGASANTNTIGTTSAQTINGASTFVQNQSQSETFCANNGNWNIF